MMSGLREESRIRMTDLHISENMCDVTEKHEKYYQHLCTFQSQVPKLSV